LPERRTIPLATAPPIGFNPRMHLPRCPLPAIAVLSLAAPLFLHSPPAAAGDWPEFRGPTADGHAPFAEVPLRWSPDSGLRWRVPVAGKAWSSPVVVDGTVYVTTAVEDGGRISLHALAYRLEDGAPLWDRELFEHGASHLHQKNSHASPTPVFEDGRLYCHFGHLGTAALEAASGEVLWRQSEIEYDPVHGNGGSPVVHGGRLIFSCDGGKDPFVVALSTADGSVLWRRPREVEVSRPFSFATPLLVEVAGETQVVLPGSGAVIAYRPEDGSEIWRCRYGEGYSVVPRPLYHEGMVYVCSGFGRAILHAIRADGQGDVTDTHLVWTADRSIPRESSPIIVDGILYINDDMGVLSAFDAKTGAEYYRERLDGQGGYSSSPVYASGHLFFHNGDGITSVVKPGERFELVSENHLGEPGLSSFAVVRDGFVVRTEGHLLRIGE